MTGREDRRVLGDLQLQVSRCFDLLTAFVFAFDLGSPFALNQAVRLWKEEMCCRVPSSAV
jgi:hypothetical protein